jgi:GT2 family glycosyltransferase
VSKKVYVIVVTYNGIKWIDKCFSSLRDSSIPLNVLAIDNNSDDETVITLKKKFPEVEVIETGVNLGFGKANNIGLKIALKEKADYVFLLNQDAWIEESCIEKLITFFIKDATYSLLSPFHYNYDQNGIEFYFDKFVLQKYSKGYNENLNYRASGEAFETSFVHAAGWLFAFDTLKAVGGFDPIFNHTGEDNDFLQRLQFKGMKVGILPCAYIYHKGTNAGLIDPQSNYAHQLNTVLLKLKNPNASLIGAFSLFFKNAFISVFKNIIQLNVKQLMLSFKISFFVLSNIASIIQSRRKQVAISSYLEIK